MRRTTADRVNQRKSTKSHGAKVWLMQASLKNTDNHHHVIMSSRAPSGWLAPTAANGYIDLLIPTKYPNCVVSNLHCAHKKGD